MTDSGGRPPGGAGTEPLGIPSPALSLGAAGALPFVFLALASHLAPIDERDLIRSVLMAYGAMILSFLGGIIWGLAIGAPFGRVCRVGGAALWPRLGIGVMPSLLGWSALFMPHASGLAVLSLCFLMVFAVDLRLTRSGWAPRWYPKLRLPLTAVVCASLLAGALS